MTSMIARRARPTATRARSGAVRGLMPLALLALPLLASLQLRAEDLTFLNGQQPKPFLDPAGFYAVVLPQGFDCEAQSRHVTCKGNRAGQALLTIDVVEVPRSATTDLVLMNQVDRFKKKPHFKMISKQKTMVDGSAAMTVSFSYDYLGNVERQVGVQALYLVRSGQNHAQQYVLHFEAPLPVFQEYAKDLVTLYASFKPARLDAAGNPMFEDLKPNDERKPDALPALDESFKHKF